MTYEYVCNKCDTSFDIIKRVAQIDDPEECPKCECYDTKRLISRTHFYGASDWDTKEFNPGLGVVTNSRKHRDKIARERGLVEVGNEDMNKFIASQDKKLDADLEERSEKALEGVVYGINEELRKAK